MVMVIEISGYFISVDGQIWDSVKTHPWCCDGKYLYYLKRIKGERIKTYYHRLVMGLPKGLVDHINRDTRDNRIINLRLCSHAENLRNRGKTKANTSGFKGVTYSKARNKWVAQIKKNYKTHFLGYFASAEAAADAYNKAALELFGDYA